MGKSLQIPRALIYQEQTDIKAFRTGSSICGVLYEHLLTIEGLAVHSGRIQEALLGVFNDTYYICTSVLVEQKPKQMLDYYWNIAGKLEEHPLFFDGFNDVRANVIYGIISCIVNNLTEKSKYIEELLDGMSKRGNGSHVEIKKRFLKICTTNAVPIFAFSAEELFMPRVLTPELLNQINLKQSTCDYDEKCVEELVMKVGRNIGFESSDERKYFLLDAIEKEAGSLQLPVPAVVERLRCDLNNSKCKTNFSSVLTYKEKLQQAVNDLRVRCKQLEEENTKNIEIINSQKEEIANLEKREPKIEGITAEEIEKGFRSIETAENRRKARTQFKEVLEDHPILQKALKNLKKDKMFEDPNPITRNITMNGEKAKYIEKNK